MSQDTLKTAIAMEIKDGADVCAKEISFSIPGAEVAKASDAIIKDIAKNVQIEGFRKGKAPAALVKVRFASYIEEDLLKKLQGTAIEKAQDVLDIVSVSAIDDNQVKPSAKDGYTCVAKIDIAPEVKLPDYAKMEVKVAKQGDVDAAAKERLDYLKGLYAEYTDTEAPAAENDMLKVSYTSDLQLAEDATPSLKRMANTDEAWVWLHDMEYVPGANAALTGAKKDDVREFTSVFPADWRESGLAGKTVNYKMTVKSVQHKDPITDDAVLAEKLHLENADKLHEMIKSQTEAKLENDKREAVRDAILADLEKTAGDFALPKSAVASETEREFSRLANQLVKSEKDIETFKADKDKHMADAKTAAEKNLRKFFIVRKIAKAQNIEVTREELDEQIRSMSAYFGYKEKDVIASLNRNGAIAEVHAGILTGKVLDFIAKTAVVAEA